MYTGRCACGEVTLSFPDVVDALFCHCAACRRASGAPMSAFAMVDAGSLSVTGATASHDDGSHGARAFCPRCGAPLFHRVAGSPHVAVALGCVDAPEAIRPRYHRHVEEQLPWVKPWDGLVRTEGGGPPPADAQGWHPPRDPTVTAESAVTLVPIDDANRRQFMMLQVAGRQMRMVAPNVLSLLQQAYARGDTWLRGIVAGDVAVGLVLVDFPAEDELGLPLVGQAFLWRYMIDEHYQGLGLGKRALVQTITAMRERGAQRFYLGCVPGAGSPMGFYARLSFVDTGKVDDGEHVMVLDLSARA